MLRAVLLMREVIGPIPGSLQLPSHNSARDALLSLVMRFWDSAEWLAFLPPVGFPQVLQGFGPRAPEA
jgi:hypothetical protein